MGNEDADRPATAPKADEPEVVYIPPLAYLRSVLALAWGVFRHPFHTTYVDLSTGEAVHVPDHSHSPAGR